MSAMDSWFFNNTKDGELYVEILNWWLLTSHYDAILDFQSGTIYLSPSILIYIDLSWYISIYLNLFAVLRPQGLIYGYF